MSSIYDVSRFHTLDSILNMEPPPITWDVRDLITRNERCVIYGEFASLKSWLLMSMTLSFATGKPWLGHYATTPRSVLYIDEENPKVTAIRRYQRLYKGLGSPELLKPIHIASRLGIRASTGFPVRLQATLDALSFQPDVIILETMRRILPGKENDQSDISNLWNVLTEVTGDTRTLILAHHMRKANSTVPDEANRDRASGNTDILAGCDSTYAVERIKKGHVRIECVKSREMEEPEPFDVILVADGEAGPAQLVRCAAGVDEKEHQVLTFISSQPQQTVVTALIEQFCKGQGISRSAMFRYLQKFQEESLLDNPVHGMWRLTKPIPPMA